MSQIIEKCFVKNNIIFVFNNLDSFERFTYSRFDVQDILLTRIIDLLLDFYDI